MRWTSTLAVIPSLFTFLARGDATAATSPASVRSRHYTAEPFRGGVSNTLPSFR
jgi:hypothetical protein